MIRTCSRLGIESVLAASDADLDVAAGPAGRPGGPARPGGRAASYLDPAAVVRAARSVGADAVHPGYGFLSENPSLARRARRPASSSSAPRPESLEAVGDKLKARSHALAAGLPVVAGRRGGRPRRRAGSRRPRSASRCWSRRSAAVAAAA